MQFTICQKHRKIEKSAHKVTTSCFVCMNRYCNHCFTMICQACKNQHRDHSNKILSLEDVSFLVERLLKSPFKELTSYIGQTVNAMKRLKLIRENRIKIDSLEKQVHKEVLNLVDYTEELIHQYAICKNSISEFSDMLLNVETDKSFVEVKRTSKQYLRNIDYNFQKDKFQYGNQNIRDQLERRRKSHQLTKRKLQQLKEYSMKIIEIILSGQESDSQEQDIIYKKKYYEILKDQLCQKPATKEESKQSKSDIQTQQSSLKSQGQHSKSTVADQQQTKAKKAPLSIQKSSQTSDIWIKEIQQTKKQYESRIQKMKFAQAKSENELKNKISILVREKDTLKKEMVKLQQKYKSKNEKIVEIEAKLRQNKLKREQKAKQKQDKFQKLIQISNWKSLLEGDKID